MMMHEPAFDRMLRIPHIIEEIFLQFLPDWSDDGPLVYGVDHAQRTKAQRQMLAQLARVCKNFSQPALDILWKNLDEFGCLLHVLPWYRIDEWGHQTQVSVSSSLSEHMRSSYTIALAEYHRRDHTFPVATFPALRVSCSWP